jgi:hypothetical protein
MYDMARYRFTAGALGLVVGAGAWLAWPKGEAGDWGPSFSSPPLPASILADPYPGGRRLAEPNRRAVVAVLDESDSRGRPGETSTQAQPPEQLDWQDVRALFASDFDLTDEDKQEFLESTLTVVEDLSVNGEVFSVRINLSEWDAEQRRDLATELGVSEARYQALASDIAELRARNLEFLTPLSQSAVGLLADSMREYWRNDMYIRARVGEPSGIPDGFWEDEKGLYGTRFATEARGWKIRVSFDSGDFPLLESTLVEIERLKGEFTLSLVALLTP